MFSKTYASACPPGYTCQAIGGATGSVSVDGSGNLVVSATGNRTLAGTTDPLYLVTTNYSGDFQLTAEVISQQNLYQGSGWGPEAGIIARTSNSPTAKFYSVFAYPNDNPEASLGNGPTVRIWARPPSRSGGTAYQVNRYTNSGMALPKYFMMQRRRNIFSASYSPDNKNWTLLNGSTIPQDNWGSALLVGIAQQEEAAGKPAENATYAHLNVGPITVNPISQSSLNCPSNWQCLDVGNSSPVGTHSLSGNIFTINGTGSNISGTFDRFTYVSQMVGANSQITGRLTGHQVTSNTSDIPNGTPLAGLMLRDSTDPAAPYYGVFSVYKGSSVIQYRTVLDGTTSTVSLSGNPTWFRIVRNNNTFTAYTSTDGVNWTSQTQAIITMSNVILSGMAVNSARERALTTATFVSVSVAGTAINSPSQTPTGSTTTASSPTLSPTPTGILLNLTVGLNGIGNAGDSITPNTPGNLSPKHVTRPVKLYIASASLNATQTSTGTITYNSSTGFFTGTVNVGALSSGNYNILLAVPGFLQKLFPNPISITKSETLPQVSLVTGDILNHNILDILNYNSLVSCFGNKVNTSSCLNPTAADINDDGVIDGVDYNLFLRAFVGQNGNGGGTFPQTPTPTQSWPTAMPSPTPISSVQSGGPITFKSNIFLKASGISLSYNGNSVKLYGATIYGSSGPGTSSTCGTAPSGSWTGSNTNRIDWDLCMAKLAHLNFIRLTNYADSASDDPFNPAIWKNIDYLFYKAQSMGIFVLMDLSSYAIHLQNQNINPYDAAQDSGWQKYISFVTHRVNTYTNVNYANTPNLAYYSVRGEVNDVGSSFPSCPTAQCYVDFYTRTTNGVYNNDSNHLIEAGGLTHLDCSTHCYPASSQILWQSIFGLAHVGLASIHVYSANRLDPINGSNDLKYTLPDVAAWAKQHNKPMDLQEYGLVNQLGDSARASDMDIIVGAARNAGFASVVYWNLGPEITAGQHYDVNPSFPISWQHFINDGSL